MSKKIITKAVSTKAFETTTVKMQAEQVYTVQPLGQRFVVCIDGMPCNKQGEQAEDIAQVFTYRNEQIAFESLVYFRRCKL
jgi:acetylornithine/succinyldiaminopimelate/putrescine aminotransferase